MIRAKQQMNTQSTRSNNMKKLKSILIVDDDKTSNLISRMVLNPLNIAESIEILVNGKEAKDHFEISTNSPELVLLDINMPYMNGFEFLDWYEENGLIGRAKFAMFTSSGRREDKDRAHSYTDVIGYIEKPLSKEKIEYLLSSVS